MILLLAIATAQAMAPGAFLDGPRRQSVALPAAESAGLGLTGALGLSSRSLELAPVSLTGRQHRHANLPGSLRMWAGSPDDAQQWSLFLGYGVA